MRKTLPSEEILRSRLAPDTNISIFIYDTVDSTNAEAKRYCQSGGNLPAIFIAREQTGGRGRLGRSFDSKRDMGLYMTLAVTPKPKATPHSLTLTAGCAALFAIKELTATTPEIKWVNDILIGRRKVAGILAEGAFDSCGNMTFALIGIGINIKKRSFPKELLNKAGSLEELTGTAPDINLLAAEITNRFFSFAEDFTATLDTYRKHLNTLGKRILVTGCEGGEFSAEACGLDAEGNLIVRKAGGDTQKLFFGEISVINQE